MEVLSISTIISISAAALGGVVVVATRALKLYKTFQYKPLIGDAYDALSYSTPDMSDSQMKKYTPVKMVARDASSYGDELSNIDIQDLLGKNRLFKGIVLHNELTSFSPLLNRQSLIINIDVDSNRGTHWVAVMRVSHGVSIYFDSFGVPPSDLVVAYLKKTCLTIQWNNRTVQATASKRCGWFCVYVIQELYHKIPYYDIIMRDFTSRPSKANEQLVYRVNRS